MPECDLNPEFVASLTHPAFDGLARTLADTPATLSVRLNPNKGLTPDHFADAADTPVPWAAGGLYLKKRPSFTFDPALHQGAYYVQDAASMAAGTIIARLADRLDNAPLTIIDACAAPGGKTLCIADAAPAGSMVVANEFDFRRAEILKENVDKWGSPTPVVVSRGDTRRFRKLKAIADIALVDAPCSGEGMMRKDATARSQWSPALVADCCCRQREILENIWPAVRPGGFLVYSTCTFNLAENENLIGDFAADHDAEFVDLPPLPDTTGNSPVASLLPEVTALRFIPGKTRSEGLFISVIRKPGNQAGKTADTPRKNKNTRKTPPIAGISRPAAWIAGSDVEIIRRADTLHALPPAHIKTLQQLERELDIISIGTEIATIKGNDFIPSQALATSAIIAADAFGRIETDTDTALAYLRRDTVTLPADAPAGFVMLTHRGLPLGFVKNLGNRCNNLYPQAWRIHSRPKPE